MKFLLVLLFLLMNGNALAYNTNNIVRVATLIDYPPYCVAEDSYPVRQIVAPGEEAIAFKGTSWEKIKKAFHHKGISIELHLVPWSRALHYLNIGKVDLVFPVGVNPKRKTKYVYSKYSLNSVDYLMYTQANSPDLALGYQGFHDKIVGVKRGFHYGKQWKSIDIGHIQNVETIEQGFNLLKIGRISGFLGYQDNWDYVLQQKSWSTLFVKLPVLESANEYVIARKNDNNSLRFLKIFEKGFKETDQHLTNQ